MRRRDESYDRLLRETVDRWGLGAEVTLWGLESDAHAEQARAGLRRAARHLGVAVKPLWRPCEGCPGGGPRAHYDLTFTVYDLAAAREYMKAKADALGWPRHGRGDAR